MNSTLANILPKKVILCLLLILIFIPMESVGQVLGLEPPSTKWQRIKTPYTEIIFQKGADLKAQRAANIITYLAERDSSYIGGPSQYVPIILHSQSTLPAGVPNLAPWRSDWTLTAPQDPFFGSLMWVDGLTIHEYRHHQQMTIGKHGWFSDFLRVILGQTGWYVGILTIQPSWFFEGDATYSETVLTNGGRGRMPKFDREYRTIRLSALDYNYEKASRGSRKDFIPNIYREGYYLTSYARKHFGTDIWTKVLEDTYKRKGIFYPFNRSLKSYTGYRTKDLYNNAMEELDSIWKLQDENLKLTKSRLISPTSKKVFTDYRFPQYTQNSEILCEKSSFQQIRTYYLIDKNGIEKKLFQPGNVTPDHVNLTISGNLITWAENRYHPRWDLKDYSVLFSYDLRTGDKKQITSKSRYYSPSASSEGNMIAALEIKTDGSQRLVLIDTNSGEKLKEFDNSDLGQYAYPRFSEDNRFIITGYTDYRGNTIRIIDAESGDINNLLPFSDQIATRPFERGEFIYYSGTNTGINNIYALSKTDGTIYQVTSSRFGAYMPGVSKDGAKLLYSEYTAMGFEIREIDLKKEEWIAFDLATPSMITYYQSLSEEEGGSIIDKIPNKIYKPEKFNSTTKGLLKFHTWTPSLDQNEYGLEFLSNNIMSNTSAILGYRYNINDKASVTYGKLSYGALFTVFDLGYSYNIRNSKYIYDDQYVASELSWKENIISGGLRLPLKLSSGTYFTSLEFKSAYEHFLLNDALLESSISQKKNFGALNNGFSFNRIKSRARQQIKPVWGQTLSIDFRKSLEPENPAELLHADGSLFFPGLNRKHSFYLTGSYQQENIINTYRFENSFQSARGFQNRYFAEPVKNDFERIQLVSLNYFFPIVFPDLDLGSLAYFQSITANPFYDHSMMEINGISSNMRSAGVDLGFEFTLLRLFRSSIILRTLHRFDLPEPDMKHFVFDFVFEIVDLAF